MLRPRCLRRYWLSFFTQSLKTTTNTTIHTTLKLALGRYCYKIGNMPAEKSYVDVVRAQGWDLYETHGYSDKTLAVYEQAGPVDAVGEGHTYHILPQPERGQRLGHAYTDTLSRGLVPGLIIHDRDDYLELGLAFTRSIAIISHLAVIDAGVRLYTPPTLKLARTDSVVLRREAAQHAFSRDFRIIDLREMRREMLQNG